LNVDQIAYFDIRSGWPMFDRRPDTRKSMTRIWSESATNPKVILWTAQKLFSFKLLKYIIEIKIRHYFQDVFEMFIDFSLTIR